MALEQAAEVAQIVKTALQCDVGDAVRGGAEQLCRALDAVIIEVVDGRAARYLPEYAAEVFRRKARFSGEVTERQRRGLIPADAPENIFHLFGVAQGARRFGC